jgi:hypothetical protein
MRSTLSQLLQRVITAQITVDSGYDVNLQASNYDIVFTRGEGSPLLNAPSYKLQGTAGILKRSLDTSRNVGSTVLQGTYQVTCHFNKRNNLMQIFSEISKEVQVYENDYILIFDKIFPDGHIKKPTMPFYDNSFSDFSLRSRVPIESGGPSQNDSLSSDYLDSHNSMGHLPDGRFAHLRPMKDTGPTDSFLHEPTLVEDHEYHEYISVSSEGIIDSPQSSTFDLTIRSRETRPSTVPTSLPHKPQKPSRGPTAPQRTKEQTDEEERMPSVQRREEEDRSLPGQSENKHDDFDTATTYSVNTLSNDPKLQYFQAFIDQLTEDVRACADGKTLKDVGQGFLDEMLRDFAWKLHEESTNPFQLETSVIIHRKRR